MTNGPESQKTFDKFVVPAIYFVKRNTIHNMFLLSVDGEQNGRQSKNALFFTTMGPPKVTIRGSTSTLNFTFIEKKIKMAKTLKPTDFINYQLNILCTK